MVRIIEEEIKGSLFSSQAFDEYFGGFRIVVADIETTGLSPKNAAVILGGAVFAEGENRRAVQFFADTPEDEPELLERYAKLLGSYDVIVTFNGSSFDLPFLIKRMKYRGLDPSGLEKLYSFDMYRVLKKHSHLTEILPDMKQKTVEKYLGDADSRTDEIDGAQSVALYFEFVESAGSRRTELMDYILLHNRDDIVRLSDMMRILKILDMHGIMFNSGFMLHAGDAVIKLEKIKIKKTRLTVEGRVLGEHTDCRMFGDGYILEIDEKNGSLRLEAECEQIQGFTVADVRRIGADAEALKRLSGYESGYLILRDSEESRAHEVNCLIRQLIYSVLG